MIFLFLVLVVTLIGVLFKLLLSGASLVLRVFGSLGILGTILLFGFLCWRFGGFGPIMSWLVSHIHT